MNRCQTLTKVMLKLCGSSRRLPKFFGFKMDLSATDQVTWKDEWCSHKEMLEKFGSEELDMHITSGRLLWREDPLTKGVYQYKDQGALSREVTLQKGETCEE